MSKFWKYWFWHWGWGLIAFWFSGYGVDLICTNIEHTHIIGKIFFYIFVGAFVLTTIIAHIAKYFNFLPATNSKSVKMTFNQFFDFYNVNSKPWYLPGEKIPGRYYSYLTSCLNENYDTLRYVYNDKGLWGYDIVNEIEFSYLDWIRFCFWFKSLKRLEKQQAKQKAHEEAIERQASMLKNIQKDVNKALDEAKGIANGEVGIEAEVSNTETKIEELKNRVSILEQDIASATSNTKIVIANDYIPTEYFASQPEGTIIHDQAREKFYCVKGNGAIEQIAHISYDIDDTIKKYITY